MALSTRARQRKLQHLHPRMRAPLRRVIEGVQARNLPFRAFECFRSPERQQWLAQRSGGLCHSQPWCSAHQYGLAADFALYLDGRYLSECDGAHLEAWHELKELATSVGLVGSGRDDMHLELAGLDLAAIRRGEYPEDGDLTWAENLRSAIARYPRDAPPPPATGC